MMARQLIGMSPRPSEIARESCFVFAQLAEERARELTDDRA